MGDERYSAFLDQQLEIYGCFWCGGNHEDCFVFNESYASIVCKCGFRASWPKELIDRDTQEGTEEGQEEDDRAEARSDT